MDAIQKKELLHLRIEQANEKVLNALAEMAEVLFKTWQPEVVEPSELSDEELADLRTPEMSVEEYEASLKPITKEELIARAKEADEDIAAGRVYSIEQVEKMFGL